MTDMTNAEFKKTYKNIVKEYKSCEKNLLKTRTFSEHDMAYFRGYSQAISDFSRTVFNINMDEL